MAPKHLHFECLYSSPVRNVNINLFVFKIEDLCLEYEICSEELFVLYTLNNNLLD